jgi:hypothetical protein
MAAQLMFGNVVNARGSGLPMVALRSLAMQASIVGTTPTQYERVIAARPKLVR